MEPQKRTDQDMEEKKIVITWYGTASIRITAGESQVLVDPFFPLADSTIEVAKDAYDGCNDILISHGHFDHIGSIKDIVRPETKVYCTKTPYENLGKMGVSEKNLKLIEPGMVLTFGDLKITVFKGNHVKLSLWDGLKAIFNRYVWHHRKGVIRKIRKFTSCREMKESVCYLVEVYGKQIIVLGSLAIAEGVTYPLNTDLVTFPYQGAMKVLDFAKDLYEKLKPKTVLLTHYDDTFPPFSKDTDTSEFEDYLKELGVPYLKPVQGSSIEL